MTTIINLFLIDFHLKKNYKKQFYKHKLNEIFNMQIVKM